MSKTSVGLLVGAILGLLDGISAIFTPAVHDILIQIVIGSTIKGLITGLFAGFVGTKTNNLGLAIVGGLIMGLGLSFAAAYFTPDPSGHRYYFQIMLPGAVLGIVAGYASQRLGDRARS